MTRDRDQILADLTAIYRQLPPTRQALAQALGDIPPTTTGHTSGHGDRTSRLALHANQDQALTDQATLDRLITTAAARIHNHQPAHNAIAAILDICNRWAPPTRRRQHIHQGLRDAANDQLNRTGDPNNCTSCRRVPGVYGEPHRRGLCKRCARWVDHIEATHGTRLELPPVALVEHSRTGRVDAAVIARTLRNNPLTNPTQPSDTVLN